MAREMALKGYRVLMLERGGRVPMTGTAPTVWTIVALAHRLAEYLHR